MRKSTPYLTSWQARLSPVGPAPMMITSVSVFFMEPILKLSAVRCEAKTKSKKKKRATCESSASVFLSNSSDLLSVVAFTFAAATAIAVSLRLRSRGLWLRPCCLRRRLLALRLWRRPLTASLRRRALLMRLRTRLLLDTLLRLRRLPHLLARGLLRLRVRPHLLRPLRPGLLALLLHRRLPLLHRGLPLRVGLLPRGRSLRLLLASESDPFALRVLRGHALRHPVRGLRRQSGLRLRGVLPL